MISGSHSRTSRCTLTDVSSKV
uniref:Uncharacterized protein n=1 Tax=Rhizophora mucronata TaxID=61149 RepID=A0A2P2NCC7_RHIMU